MINRTPDRAFIWRNDDVDTGNCVVMQIIYEGPIIGAPVPTADCVMMLNSFDYDLLKAMQKQNLQ